MNSGRGASEIDACIEKHIAKLKSTYRDRERTDELTLYLGLSVTHVTYLCAAVRYK